MRDIVIGLIIVPLIIVVGFILAVFGNALGEVIGIGIIVSIIIRGIFLLEGDSNNG